VVHEVTSLRSQTLAEQVQQEIREYVIQNGLRPGDALPSEGEFARRFDVSRNAVREGIKALESSGLIEVRRGNGIFVKEFSFAPLLANLPYGLLTHERPLSELLQVRKILELGLIERVVLEHHDGDLAAADAALAAMRERAMRGEHFPSEDRAFHRALFIGVVSNEMILDLIDVFWLAFDQAARQLDLHTRAPLATYEAHAAIVEAVRARDVARTRARLEKHYAEIAARLDLTRIDTPGTDQGSGPL
jgi:DNA-binding FadR family transcriptional regulator